MSGDVPEAILCRVNVNIPAGVVIGIMENGIVCAVAVNGRVSGDFSRAHTTQFSAEDFPAGTADLVIALAEIEEMLRGD